MAQFEFEGLNGTLMAIYLALVQDVETDPQAAADYSPDVADYERLGLSTGLSIGESRSTIDTSSKDSGLEPSLVGGRRSGDISAPCNFDDERDPGQQVVRDAMQSERGELYWFATQNKVGKIELWGRAIVTDSSLDFPEEDVSTLQFSATRVGPMMSQLQPEPAATGG